MVVMHTCAMGRPPALEWSHFTFAYPGGQPLFAPIDKHLDLKKAGKFLKLKSIRMILQIYLPFLNPDAYQSE